MPSRGEQLQSYQFMVQRVVSALVLRETDPPQSPFSRAVSATFASVIIAVIIAAGFGVYSVFTGGGNQKWKQEGAVVIEKNSSAAFVYNDGKLWPALNLASAILASENPKPPRFSVSARSLQGVPWGDTIGIENLPNSLADKKNLAKYPWSVCSVSGPDGPISAVLAGQTKGNTVPDTQAMLVEAATRVSGKTDTYLLWRGRLYEVSATSATTIGQGVQPTPVATAFINGLPKGQALEPLRIEGATLPATFSPARTVGQAVPVVGVDAKESYVVIRKDDVAWITQMQAALLPDKSSVRMTLNELTNNGAVKVGNDLLPTDSGPNAPPRALPSIEPYGGPGLCSVLADEAGNVELRTDVTLTEIEKRPITVGRNDDNAVYADYVVLPAGTGAIVRSGNTYSYVSRDGVRYSAANPQVLAKLGYDGVAPLRLPSEVVALLPAGPGLDPTKALETVTRS